MSKIKVNSPEDLDITDPNEPDYTVQVLVNNPDDLDLAVGNLAAALMHLEHQEGQLWLHAPELIEIHRRLGLLVTEAKAPF